MVACAEVVRKGRYVRGCPICNRRDTLVVTGYRGQSDGESGQVVSLLRCGKCGAELFY